jgi:exopolyphosphatase/guanosine-5'-triphosphate,3'-diphosphate pyrophosphatase
MHNIFAAIDLGSNSFHMVVGKLDEGKLVILDRLKEMVRLASGLDNNKSITPEAMQTSLDCLARFGERIRHLNADVVRIVGTNTLRQARNARTFMRQAEALLGQPIEIISGIEEARLIYSGVAHNVDTDNGRRLVVDIGGGSTEIIIGERFEPFHLESLYMGCVNMSQQFFGNGKITEKKLGKARLHALSEMEPYIKTFQYPGWQTAIGASGTIRAIEKIAIAEEWLSQGIDFMVLDKLKDHFLQAEQISNISLKGLKDERKPVIVGGVMVLRTLFEAFKVEKMVVSDGALREGILYDLIGREEHHDVRSESVERLAQRFVIDRDHAKRVEQTCLSLFRQVRNEFQENEEACDHLQWSARLHEAGLSIAHSQYYRHGAYILGNADLLGFSRQDQKLLAAIVASHRRSLHLEAFDELDDKHRAMGIRLLLILRIAVLLNRSRTETLPPTPDISISNKQVLLKFPDQWLHEHPLTQSDLENESTYLSKADFTLEFS